MIGMDFYAQLPDDPDTRKFVAASMIYEVKALFEDVLDKEQRINLVRIMHDLIELPEEDRDYSAIR